MYGILLTKEQLDFLKDDRQGFHRMTAFDTFVSMASIKPTSYQKTGFSTRLSVGQFAISTVELSALWKCDRKTAAKVIDLFNQVGILSTERNNRTSIHTIRCIAFWYVDGIKDAIKNPFYHRQAASATTQEKGVSEVPSNTSSLLSGNLSKDICQQKDNGASSATIDIQQTNVSSSSKELSPSVESGANKDDFSNSSFMAQDFEKREDKSGNGCSKVGQPLIDNESREQHEPYIAGRQSFINDNADGRLPSPSDRVQDADNQKT